jgi:hypothetical protein
MGALNILGGLSAGANEGIAAEREAGYKREAIGMQKEKLGMEREALSMQGEELGLKKGAASREQQAHEFDMEQKKKQAAFLDSWVPLNDLEKQYPEMARAMRDQAGSAGMGDQMRYDEKTGTFLATQRFRMGFMKSMGENADFGIKMMGLKDATDKRKFAELTQGIESGEIKGKDLEEATKQKQALEKSLTQNAEYLTKVNEMKKKHEFDMETAKVKEEGDTKRTNLTNATNIQIHREANKSQEKRTSMMVGKSIVTSLIGADAKAAAAAAKGSNGIDWSFGGDKTKQATVEKSLDSVFDYVAKEEDPELRKEIVYQSLNEFGVLGNTLATNTMVEKMFKNSTLDAKAKKELAAEMIARKKSEGK